MHPSEWNSDIVCAWLATVPQLVDFVPLARAAQLSGQDLLRLDEVSK